VKLDARQHSTSISRVGSNKQLARRQRQILKTNNSSKLKGTDDACMHACSWRKARNTVP
jgi:hypothetical protein